MVTPLSPRRIVEESVPVAAVLLVWTVPAELLYGIDGAFVEAARLAGLVMALLYVTVRGLRLGRSLPPTTPPRGVSEVLLDNARAGVAAGVWILAAALFTTVWGFVDAHAGFPSQWSIPFVNALAGAAVGTVLLYAIANGSSRVHSPLTGRRGRGVRTN